MFKRYFIFLFILIQAGLVWAADLSVTAHVSSNKLTLKESSQLILSVIGSKDDIDLPPIPKIEGLDIQYQGPNVQISIVNGQYSSKRSYVYSIFPNKVGKVQIPALDITVSGQAFKTQPIDVEVMADAVAPAESPEEAKAKAMQRLQDRVFMVVSTPSPDVYLSQKVPLNVKLFVSELPVRNIGYPQMEQKGFRLDNMAQPSQYNQMLNGMQYNVVDFKAFVYPSRTGEVEIGPTRIDASMLYKPKDQNPVAESGLFADSFFSSLFSSVQERAITVNAQALKLNVLPWPKEGRPDSFSGTVGKVDLEISVTPAQVRVGDPISLRMKLSGDGNIKNAVMPVFKDSRFKVYEPQVKDEPGAKIVEQVIIPTTDDIKEVPAIEYAYLDPQEGKYVTILKGPFPLKVSAPQPGQEFKAVGFTNLPSSTAAYAQVDYVQKYIVDPVKAFIAFARTPRFWLYLAGLFLIGGGLYAWRIIRTKILSNADYTRKLNALKEAKAGIKQAANEIKSQNPQAFYAILHKTLIYYIADKFTQVPGELHWPQIKILLEEKNIAQAQMNAVKDILDTCDLVRFSGLTQDTAQMEQDLSKLQNIISILDKNLK